MHRAQSLFSALLLLALVSLSHAAAIRLNLPARTSVPDFVDPLMPRQTPATTSPDGSNQGESAPAPAPAPAPDGSFEGESAPVPVGGGSNPVPDGSVEGAPMPTNAPDGALCTYVSNTPGGPNEETDGYCTCSGGVTLGRLWDISNPCGYTQLPLATPVTITTTDSLGVVYVCENSFAPAPTTCTGFMLPISTDQAIASAAAASSSAAAAQASWAAAQAKWDNPLCLSQSEDGFYMFFLVFLPNWQSVFDFNTANNDLRGSLGDNSACSGYSMYQSIPVGQYNTTLCAVFYASDFCTDWEVTQVIKATTGGVQGTACNSANSVQGDPDISNVLGELMEYGDDGEDIPIKRRERASYLGNIADVVGWAKTAPPRVERKESDVLPARAFRI